MTVAAFLPVSTWDREFVASLREHYSGSAGAPPGKKIAWRILVGGRHLGWIGLGEPSFALAARRRLGLPPHPPQPLTVGCFIYRVEAQGLARSSDVLKDWHVAASAEWNARYGFIPLHRETLVDPEHVESKVAGACFRRASYRSLGWTTGRGARRPAGSTHGARVWGPTSRRLVFYRGPLARVDAGGAQ
ncbi:MAG TPA: hypothetical protein VHG72_21700 [Polyangia bacterium]|nr:hypothetical protein [Polyangia bacterium]